MQNHAAVFRTGESLKEGVHRIAECYEGLEDLKVVKFYTRLISNLESALALIYHESYISFFFPGF